MTKDAITLLILLAVVLAVVYGLHHFGSKIDNKSKYTHPITRPGTKW